MVDRLSQIKNNFTRKLSSYYDTDLLIYLYRFNYGILSVYYRDHNYEGSPKMLSGYNYKKKSVISYYDDMYMLSNYDCPDKDEDENSYE
jgi:hypothetical protein